MNNYVIAGNADDLWAINPQTRQRIKINSKENSIDKWPVLDLYANGTGIYHASKLTKKVEDKTRHLFL